jgi:hypothetical protein
VVGRRDQNETREAVNHFFLNKSVGRSGVGEGEV